MDDIDQRFCTKNTALNHTLQKIMLNSPIKHLPSDLATTSKTLNMVGRTEASDKNSFRLFMNDSNFSSTNVSNISASIKKACKQMINHKSCLASNVFKVISDLGSLSV